MQSQGSVSGARSTTRLGKRASDVVVIGMLVGAVLAGAVTVSFPGTATAGEAGEAAAIGWFDTGDELETSIDERDGAVRFDLPAGGINLRWDSRAPATDRYGLGPRWSLGLPYVAVSGGVRVFPSSGGVLEADASHASGLRVYGAEDIAFVQEPGTVPARGGASNVDYAFVLHELGGVITYFNESGDPVARRDAGENWTTWEWDPGVAHRLVKIIGPESVVTVLEWDEADGVRVLPGTNVTAADSGAGVGGAWTIVRAAGTIAQIIDPVESTVDLMYDDIDLVAEIRGSAGAVTNVSWLAGADGAVRVARLRTSHAQTGATLSERNWESNGSATGWPLASTAESSESGYSTTLSDGATRIESDYNAMHLLIGRRLVAAGSGGDRVVQEQKVRYPSTDDDGRSIVAADSLPGDWSWPSSTQVTVFDRLGRSRTVRETSDADAFGRETRRVAADGTVTETEYDPVVPPHRRLPVGAPVVERVSATDGSVIETRRELNAERNAPVAEEHWSSRPGVESERVAYTEFDADPDGFVTEERRFAGGDDRATPVVTGRQRSQDPGSGIAVFTTTAGGGADRSVQQTIAVSLVHGGQLAETGPLDRTERTEYDLAGRAVAAIDAAGRRTEIAYESERLDGRNAVTVTGPDGVARTEVSDPLGRVVSISDNIDHGVTVAGHVRSIETRDYSKPGTVRVTDAWGAIITRRVDVIGRTTATESSTGVTQVIEYDDVAGVRRTAMSSTGRLVDATMVTEERTDEAGRLVETSQVRADGRAAPNVSHQYDGFGRTISVSDGVREMRTGYDLSGNPTSTTSGPGSEAPSSDADGAGASGASGVLTAERRFDGFGSSLEKVLSDGAQARSGGSRTLDQFGRVAVETDQLGRATTFEYTADGLISRTAAGSGQVREYEYDPLTRQLRVERISSPVGEPVETAYEYDTAGRTVAMFDPASPEDTRIRYEYDAHGNVLATAYPDGNEIRNEYDLHGRRTATIDVAGNRSEFRYDDAGRLTGVEQSAATGTIAGVSYRYDALGRIDRVELRNGVVTEYAFTSASEIELETTTSGGHPVSERRYRYDARGNLVERTDVRHDQMDEDAEPGAGTETRTTVYEYDVHDRLIASSVQNGQPGEAPAEARATYELDVSGDVRVERTITQRGTDAEHEAVREFEYSAVGELIAVTNSSSAASDVAAERVEQDYDGAGNLVGDVDGASYRYDAANRLRAEFAPDGGVVTTTYWPDGMRRARHDGASGSSTTFYWDDDTLMNDVHTGPDGGEHEEAGTAAYLVGANRHARVTASYAALKTPQTEIAYYTTDRHGSVTELTDGAGSVTGTYDYGDYGAPAATRPSAQRDGAGLRRNPFRFAGEFVDESGHQYLRARMYHPELMRFSSMDSAPFFNKAGYADANPIMNVDPTGYATQDDWLYVGLAALGIALSFVGLVTAAGTSAAVFGFATFSTVADVAFTAADVVNNVHHRFMSKEVEAGLGWTAFGLGLGTAIFGIFAEVADRVAHAGAKTVLKKPLLEFGDHDRALLKRRELYKPRRQEEAKSIATGIKTFTTKSLGRNPFTIDDVSYTYFRRAAALVIKSRTPDPAPLIGHGGLWQKLFNVFSIPEENAALIAKYAEFGVPTDEAVLVAKTVKAHVPAFLDVVNGSQRMRNLWNYWGHYRPKIDASEELVEDSTQVIAEAVHPLRKGIVGSFQYE